jgi:hypothetical protein
MDVHIGEMNSSVKMTDSQALLSPQVLERIVRIVLQRLREEQSHGERAQQERELRPAASAREATNWE